MVLPLERPTKRLSSRGAAIGTWQQIQTFSRVQLLLVTRISQWINLSVSALFFSILLGIDFSKSHRYCLNF